MNTQKQVGTVTPGTLVNRQQRRAAAKAAKAKGAAKAAVQGKVTAQAASAKPVTDHRDYYRTAYLKNWPREAGPAVPMALLDAVHAIDPAKRPGHEALNIAMCMRQGGASVREFLLASNAKGPAHNYRRALIGVDRVLTDSPLPGDGRAYRFRVALTAKGAALLKAAGVTLPKGIDAPQPKAARKRKPKAAPQPAPQAPAPAAPQGDQPAPQA